MRGCQLQALVEAGLGGAVLLLGGSTEALAPDLQTPLEVWSQGFVYRSWNPTLMDATPPS